MACAAPQSLRAPPSLPTCCKSTFCASWAATGSLSSQRALSGTLHLHQKTLPALEPPCNECLGILGLGPLSGKALRLLLLPLVPELVLMMKATSGAALPCLAVLCQDCYLPFAIAIAMMHAVEWACKTITYFLQ